MDLIAGSAGPRDRNDSKDITISLYLRYRDEKGPLRLQAPTPLRDPAGRELRTPIPYHHTGSGYQREPILYKGKPLSVRPRDEYQGGRLGPRWPGRPDHGRRIWLGLLFRPLCVALGSDRTRPFIYRVGPCWGGRRGAGREHFGYGRGTYDTGHSEGSLETHHCGGSFPVGVFLLGRRCVCAFGNR